MKRFFDLTMSLMGILFLLPISLALFRRGWVICLLPTLLFLANPETATAHTTAPGRAKNR